MKNKIFKAATLICLAVLFSLFLFSGCKPDVTPDGKDNDNTPPAPRETITYTITEEKLYDQIKGSMFGQMAGVTYSAPSEFRANGFMYDLANLRPWKPSVINEGFGQDDMFVDITFIDAVKEYGLDCTTKEFGEAFRASTYGLAHGNKEARKILQTKYVNENGEEVYYDAPMSGHYSMNQCCEDIDWAIECDWVGMLYPGMVEKAADMSYRAGQVIGYGEGILSGNYISALHAYSFFATDIEDLFLRAVAVLPKESKNYKIQKQVYDLWKNGTSFEDAWYFINDEWLYVERCPECAGSTAMNITGYLNEAFSTMGLLYGNGDLKATMDYAMRCGQDSDCNSSTAAGVLGNMLGFSYLEDYQDGIWVSGINNTAKFSGTEYTMPLLVDTMYEIAVTSLNTYADKTEEGWVITEYKDVQPYEIPLWPNMPSVFMTVVTNDFDITGTAKIWDELYDCTVLWDFGNGDTSSSFNVKYTYPEAGIYEVSLTATNSEGISKTVKQQVYVGKNLAKEGTITLSVTKPLGGGSKDPEVIRDGKYADSIITNAYDTFTGINPGKIDFVGYIFDTEKTFSTVIYNEGGHFDNGGWFETGLQIQVLIDGEWVPIEYGGDEYIGVSWVTNSNWIYVFTFDSVTAKGVRLYGTAGGSAGFVSIGELQVY